MKRPGQTITSFAIIILASSLLAGCSDSSRTAHQQAEAAAQAAATPPSQRVSAEQAAKTIEDNPNIPANAKAIILGHMAGHNTPPPNVH